MEAKKEDFDEKTYEDVNMKELVGYMNKATDNRDPYAMYYDLYQTLLSSSYNHITQFHLLNLSLNIFLQVDHLLHFVRFLLLKDLPLITGYILQQSLYVLVIQEDYYSIYISLLLLFSLLNKLIGSIV